MTSVMRGDHKLSPDSDLVFQVVSWNALDHEYDDGDSSDPSKYLVKVFGVTEDGASISVNVLDFTPYFFIRLDHKVNKFTANHLHEFVVSQLLHQRQDETGLIDVTIMKKKDFWGFTNNELAHFARFKFRNLKTFKKVSYMFNRKVHIRALSKDPIKYKLYESNLDPFLRMMHIQNVEPCGWIKIRGGEYEETCILPTHCQIDVECRWKALEPHMAEKIAPLIVASFDIECTSSHGDFPVAAKNYKKTAYEVIQYFNDHKTDDLVKDKLLTEIVKIFHHDEPGIFSKAITKTTPNVTAIELKLKRSMDEIFAVISGKLNYKGAKETAASAKDNIMKLLTAKFDEYFPALMGDEIIQIGTTVHYYGETACHYRNILTLGTCEPIDGVDVVECSSEKELLLKWRDLILKLDPDIITGYNIFGFDMSYMYQRAQELKIEFDFCKIGRIIDQSSKYVEKELSSSALGDNLLKYVDMEGRVLIDVMKVVQRDHKLDSYKLDAVASHFMKMNKNDVHPSDIFRLQKGSAADRKIVAEYCVQDCALCNHLIMKLDILANNIGMSNVCKVPLSFIFMRGQGIKIFSLVAKECREDDLLIPTITPIVNDDGTPEDQEGYEGAIVLEPKEGIYIDDPVCVLDYASLYPSSMISENLSHDSIILDPKYDNLPGLEYLDISYDVFEKIDDKKVKTGVSTVRYVQLPDGQKSTIPKILMKLLRARKETRKKIEFKTVVTAGGQSYVGMVKEDLDKGVVRISRLDGSSDEVEKADVVSMEDTYNDFQKAVLDGLQLAYKVTANSLYGQCGAKTSPIYMKEIAACTTATGRKMILMARDYILENYEGAEIVYGDSVTGYTPILIRVGDSISYEKIENIAAKYGGDKWIPCSGGKEGCDLAGADVLTWTSSGWTELQRVIRHALAPHKSILRVLTHTGVVDVTDEHSLINSNHEIVDAKSVKIGDTLLHKDLPDVSDNMYDWCACWCTDMSDTYIDGDSQIYAASMFMLASSKGYDVCIDTLEDTGKYRLTMTKRSQRKNPDAIKKISNIDYSGYVYDLTTANHEFAAGVGRLIVHNTDSIMVKFPAKDEDGNEVKGKDAIMPSIRTGKHVSQTFKKHLKAPHDLEFEKIFYPFILFSKKRYCANKYEYDDVHFKMNSMGIVLKRRDNAPIVKTIYGGILDIILNERDVKKSVQFLKDTLNGLVDGKYPLDDLVVTKSLRSEYKDPDRIAHKVLAERMGERDPGTKPQVNDRIPFVFVQIPEKKGVKLLQGDRIEHPDYIKAKKLKPDYEFYITNQIMKPVLQLYALALEDLDGYRKGRGYFDEVRQKLIKEKEGDLKKVKDRLNDLREEEVKKLLFDPILIKLQNKKNGNMMISDYFK